MRVVVISTCRAVAVPTVRAVVERWPDTVTFRPTEAKKPRSLSRLRDELANPIATADRHYNRIHLRRQDSAIRAALGPPRAAPPGDREVIDSTRVNHESMRQRLAELAPDVLVLFGSPILREPVLAVPRLGTLNVHLGIAPEYRGEHTIFQALRRRDHDHIGATIHHVDRGVDSGPLVTHVFPALDPCDDETSLLVKTAQLLGPALVDYLDLVERSDAMPGRVQDGPGALFRRADRHVWQDGAEWLERRVLGRRPPSRPERIVRYYEPAKGRLSVGGSATWR